MVKFQAGAITFSTCVQPICLWNGDTPPAQTEGYIGGWGKTILRSSNEAQSFDPHPGIFLLNVERFIGPCKQSDFLRR